MKIKKIIIKSFIILLFILSACLSIFLIVKFKIKVNFTALATVVSIVALLYTIIKDRKETKKLIDYNIRINNQLEFENKLYEVINVYNKLIRDINGISIKFIRNSDYEYIDDNLSDRINTIACNYTFELIGMKNKILYFYKYKDKSIINKLLDDIDNTNQLLNIDLARLATLRGDISNINYLFSSVKYEKDFKNKKKVINNTHKETLKLNKSLFEIANNINKTINDNYNLILNDAMECIEMRKNI